MPARWAFHKHNCTDLLHPMRGGTEHIGTSVNGMLWEPPGTANGQECAAGSFCAGGAAPQQLCTPARTKSHGIVRVPAVPEHTRPRGSTWCMDCPAGYEAPLSGASACARCNTGRYQDERQAFCLPCVPGTYSTTSARDTQCDACPLGFFTNTTALTSCTRCEVGRSTSAPASTACFDEPPGAANGQECAAGSFCAGRAAPQQPHQALLKSHGIVRVPAPGTYAASNGSTWCIECPAGFAAPESGASCARRAELPLMRQASRRHALAARLAHHRSQPPSLKLTASARKTTGESVIYASRAWHVPFALPTRSNLLQPPDSGGSHGAIPPKLMRGLRVCATHLARGPHHPKRTRRKNGRPPPRPAVRGLCTRFLPCSGLLRMRRVRRR